MLLWNLYIPFRIDGAFTDLQVACSVGTNAPPSEIQTFELSEDNKLDNPSLL